MSSKFYYAERDRQQALLVSSAIFGHDGGNGLFSNGKHYPFVLSNGKNNLYEQIANEAKRYVEENEFKWWGELKSAPHIPTGHLLSSQVACFNHLMLIRKCKESVLDLINGLGVAEFEDVLPIEIDRDNTPGYIGFEVVSDHDYLNEGKPTRGRNCTSVDACILAKTKSETWLIPIEWKYTEYYCDSENNDKSSEIKDGVAKGEERMRRYNDLIKNSEQLKTPPKLNGSIYYYQPFYQLMRQTLWAEQMVEKSERIKADRFLHVHVIPKANIMIREKRYRLTGKNLEESWKDQLRHPEKYILVDPEEFMKPLEDKYPKLMEYLHKRYYAK